MAASQSYPFDDFKRHGLAEGGAAEARRKTSVMPIVQPLAGASLLLLQGFGFLALTSVPGVLVASSRNGRINLCHGDIFRVLNLARGKLAKHND
jgi:hypothetical protein